MDNKTLKTRINQKLKAINQSIIADTSMSLHLDAKITNWAKILLKFHKSYGKLLQDKLDGIDIDQSRKTAKLNANNLLCNLPIDSNVIFIFMMTHKVGLFESFIKEL